MTTLTLDTTAGRRSYQQHVTTLLQQIDEGRRRLYLLQAAGARPAALGELKGNLQALRREMAAAIATRRGFTG